ncbi:MAG: ABC transporter permease subunit, partial [Chloroflexota bacterium]|nr:ABC transporter permease subunit [Chloroflexota bacterium]
MKLSNRSIYLISALAILLLWKVLAVLLSSPVLPPPEVALQTFAESLKTREFWGHLGASSFRVITAMALSWAIAFPLGILLGYDPRFDKLFSPFVFLTYPIPKIVFLPIILVLLGLGDPSKIVLITLIIFYQILIATRDGVVAINKKYIDSIKSLGGGRYQIVRHVLIPAALPHCFTALRIGTGTSIAVLFFVESFATTRGLGYYIMDSWGRASYDQMFVGIIGMSLLGALLYGFFGYLERSLCTWKLLESGQPVLEKASLGQKGKAVAQRIRVFGSMIKFSHTLFAMPFALAAVVLAQKEVPITVELVILIIVALVGARSAAMGFNRLVDARIDAMNPRTAERAIPQGLLT